MFDTTRTYRLSIRDQLRMANIDRWQIMKLDRTQSVAEHTCNVVLICAEILREMEKASFADGGPSISAPFKLGVMEAALWHDLPEVMTGDIPTPMKMAFGPDTQAQLRSIDRCFLPRPETGDLARAIVKAADFIDAIHFLTNEGRDVHSASVLHDLVSRLECHISRSDALIRDAIQAVYMAAINGKQTFMENLV